jgi:hypothetical protein
MLKQRRYERVAFYCSLHLTLLPNGPTVSARSFDISVGGVGIAANILPARGQAVRVRFHKRSSEWTGEDVVGRVAYSRADEDGNRIGVEFVEQIQEATHPMLASRLNAL